MDDDWQETLYEYSHLDRDEEEVQSEIYEGDDRSESDGGEIFEDEDPFRVDFEDDELKPDFKQMQQLAGDKGLGTGAVPTIGRRAQKAMRSVEEQISDQIKGILYSDAYSDLQQNKKDVILSKAESISGVQLYNLELLIQAIMWTTLSKELNKKNLAEYVKRYDIKDAITLIAYVRMLEK